MKKIFVKIAVLALGAMSLASCRKSTDWNLNPAPAIELLSTKIITKANDTIVVGGSDLVLPFDGSRVELKYKLTGGNPLSQLTFHDGTWDNKNMSLISSAIKDTLPASPPATKFIINGTKEETITIVLKSVTSDVILSMILNDNTGSMSASNVTKLKVKNIEVNKESVKSTEVDFTTVGKKSDSVVFVKSDLSSVLDTAIVNSAKFKANLVDSKIKADSLDKLYPSTAYAFVKIGGSVYLTQTDSLSKYSSSLSNKLSNAAFGFTKDDKLNDTKFFYANYYGTYKYKSNSSISAPLATGDMLLINTKFGKAYLKITSITGNNLKYEVIPYTIRF